MRRRRSTPLELVHQRTLTKKDVHWEAGRLPEVPLLPLDACPVDGLVEVLQQIASARRR